MGFHVTHRLGETSDASFTAFDTLLAELNADIVGSEHADVAVTHESEWCLSAHRGGYIVFEHLEEGEPRHMRDVPAEKIIALWRALAAGDLEILEREPWRAGY